MMCVSDIFLLSCSFGKHIRMKNWAQKFYECQMCAASCRKKRLTLVKVETGKSGQNSGLKELCCQTEVVMEDAAGICVVP